MSINKTKKILIRNLKNPVFIILSIMAVIFSSNDKRADYVNKNVLISDFSPMNFIQLANGGGGGDGGDGGGGGGAAGGGSCGAGGVGDCGAGSSGGSTGDSGAGGDASFTPNQPTPTVNIYFN